ncbi:hypothetical protein [Acrocarpospora sp. B8E8]|uniref:hypothetical protein n=1 Tax=Acrocarpospora sp. B8E8 TaxID=3153572 RepID=UPI00325D801F
MSSAFVPLSPWEAVATFPERALEVVEYRESGLSLNHVQGLPARLSRWADAMVFTRAEHLARRTMPRAAARCRLPAAPHR